MSLYQLQRKFQVAECSYIDYASFRKTLKKVKILSAIMENLFHWTRELSGRIHVQSVPVIVTFFCSFVDLGLKTIFIKLSHPGKCCLLQKYSKLTTKIVTQFQGSQSVETKNDFKICGRYRSNASFITSLFDKKCYAQFILFPVYKNGLIF